MSAKERLPPKKFSTMASIASLDENGHVHDDSNDHQKDNDDCAHNDGDDNDDHDHKRTRMHMNLTRWRFWFSEPKL